MYEDINTKAEICLFTNARPFKIPQDIIGKLHSDLQQQSPFWIQATYCALPDFLL